MLTMLKIVFLIVNIMHEIWALFQGQSVQKEKNLYQTELKNYK